MGGLPPPAQRLLAFPLLAGGTRVKLMAVQPSVTSHGFSRAGWQWLLQPIGEHSVLSVKCFVMGLSFV